MTDEQPEAWTVLKLLEWTTGYFKDCGSDSARLDAELLLAEARGCERIELYTAFDQEPDEDVRTAFRELVRRRGEGTPVAYLLGRKEFYSMSFRVNEDTLIPRPETEHLVIEVLDEVKRRGADKTPLLIADIGTGSGVIAVCLAKNLPASRVTAIDVSDGALTIAKQNAEYHQTSDRISFLNSDLFDSVSSESQFDFICSNPPYVSDQEYEELDNSVKGFEPKTALVSGPQGTEIIERLIDQSIPRLKTGGRLVFELSPMIASQATEYLAGVEGAVDVRVIKDLAGRQRIISVAKDG